MKVLGSILVLCCVAAIQAAPRIIGGSTAPDGKYPYLVSLRSYGSHFCGGSIISKRWILTAAHCLLGSSASDITVVAGTNKQSQGGTKYQGEYVVAHDDFAYNLNDPDVGLLRVAEDIQFTDKVQPIKLPSENFQKVNYPSLLAGWGSTKLGGYLPNNLQEIELNVISLEKCKARWAAIYPDEETVTDAHVCTLNKVDQGMCHGDSGSPLAADGVQIGLASFVSPCAEGEPDVFTRVYSYLDWISNEIKKYENNVKVNIRTRLPFIAA